MLFQAKLRNEYEVCLYEWNLSTSSSSFDYFTFVIYIIVVVVVLSTTEHVNT